MIPVLPSPDPTPKAALRWRYAYKRYDAYMGKEYSDVEYAALDPDDPVDKVIRDRLTSKPLRPYSLERTPSMIGASESASTARLGAASTPCGAHPRDRLIRCGPFGMVDHEHIDGRSSRFEFEAELFLHRRE